MSDMSDFQNVRVDRAANLYFDGRVSSRRLQFADGSCKTLGVMLPGEYDFGTEAAELMEITSGDLEVRLPGRDDWQRLGAGARFEVPAQSRFQVRVHGVTDYCCSYLP